MLPEHQYYDEVNTENGAYYRRWASNFGPYMSKLIDDFGLMKLDFNQCRSLFQEHTYADTCLTRLLSNSYRLGMNGKNMRNMKPINQ